MTLLGAHVTTGSRNGYGSFVAAKPRLVVSVNEGGALLEAAEKSGGHTVTIFRDTTVYLEAPLDFDTYPGSMADLAGYWYPRVREKWALNQADYYTITNEIGGNDPISISRLVDYEREFMRLANADGFRVCVLNPAGGSPGDFGLWIEHYVPLILEAWAAGNIYGRHVYGGDLVDASGHVMPGNPSRPIQEAEYLRSRGRGGIALTECGLDGGFGYAGEPRFSQQMEGYERALRPHADMIIGLAAWNLGSWQASNANWQDSIPTLVNYMNQNPTTPWSAPVSAETNLLPNPSYEGGWWHKDLLPELQVPDQWDLTWKSGSVITEDGYVFMALRPEARVMPKEQLPPHEQLLFILDGRQTVKVFKGYGAVDFKLFTKPFDLPAGDYELHLNIYPDLVAAYENGEKVLADDPLAGEYRFYINGVSGSWRSLYPYGEWIGITHDLEWQGGEISLGVQLRSRYALQNSGFFLDAHSLELIEGGGVVTPPSKIKHTIVLMPQDTTLAEQDEIAHELYPNRTGFTYSADLAHAVVYAGTSGSKVIIYGPERWQNSIEDWMRERGITYELRPMPIPPTGGGENDVVFKAWPTTEKRITQRFGNNPEYYAQFGLPGHEGIDLAAPIGSPYYAVADGVVTRVTDKKANGTPSAYGWHCIIDHGHFTTLYAHAQDNLPSVVQVGEPVSAGDIVGYSGNTGISSGPHLHLTLKIDGYVAPGWACCPGYADPYPYLFPLMHAVLPPTPPFQEGWIYRQYTQEYPDNLLVAQYGLNFRERPSIISYKYGVLRVGAAVLDLGNQEGGYTHVRASINDIIDYRPAPDRGVLIGAHMSADPSLAEGEIGAIANMNPSLLKVLSTLQLPDVNTIARDFKGVSVIIRPFLHWGERNISPEQFVEWTMPDTRRTMLALSDGRDVILELPGNETNLKVEGWTHSWNGGREYADWARQVFNIYKQAFPTTKIYYPGLSPGGDIPGVRADSWEFLSQSAGYAALCDGICIHVYVDPPNGYTVDRALGEVDTYCRMFPTQRFVISEFSWNKNNGTPAEKANVFLDFWRRLAQFQQVHGVVWFVSSATNPDWSWASGTGEVLVEGGGSVGITEIVGNR